MKVLIIAQYFPPDMGGGATRAYNAALGLVKANNNVTVVTAFPHYPKGNVPKKYRKKALVVEYSHGMKIIRTFVPPVASEGIAKRVLLFVSFMLSSLFALPFIGEIDVAWAANPNVISFYSSYIYKNALRCPLTQNVDDLWPETLYDLGLPQNSFLAKFGELLARISYNHVSAITPISPAYIKVINGKYKVNPKKICLIPGGVDIDNFSKNNRALANKNFEILYIGSFSQAYDFDQVFKAARLLASQPEISFTIRGGGELADHMKAEIERLRLTNVQLIDKIVSREEVARLLCEADLLLLPLNGGGSIEMGLSSKLYEYQAAGKAILCCSNGQSGRYISETKSGLVIQPGDFEALAKSALYLKQNPSIASQLGASGRQFIENNLTTESIGLKMKALFEAM